MKKIILCLFMLSISTSLFSQDKPYITITYFGELICHPGISISMGYPILEYESIELDMELSAIYYIHPGNHKAIIPLAGLAVKWFITDRFFLDLRSGIGPFFSSPDSSIISRYDQDQIITEPSSWSTKFTFYSSVSAGIRTGSKYLSDILLRIGVLGEYPFNNYLYLHPILELGTSF